MAKVKRPAPAPKELVLATNNRHKVREITAILRGAGLKIRVRTLADFPKAPPVVENKPTIEGNAIKKAKEVADRLGLPALADDTGLFIDALRGKPGVYSARFAGPGCTFEDNNRKALRLLKNVPPKRRTATFRCIAALAAPKGNVVLAEGRIRGRIATEISGGQGFGYDPVFYVPSARKTFAQMSGAAKNRISHRGRAFRQVPKLWRHLFGTAK
ncbi:MAG: RdgB/HAM1 family non-canonical purine NTP pyrophosphatase [Elusimicrobia bacterium]|nr:RdgB/HAM1 family non-canonical purine NTP pyrophosphatase [Elusimicrobiota bacterium]